MWASATPATQSTAAPRPTNGPQARHQIPPILISAPRVPRKTKSIWPSGVTKDGVWQSCVWQCKMVLYVWQSCVEEVAEEAEEVGRRSGRDTETKTRTPHKDVGNYTTINFWDILGTQILEESMCSPQFFPWFTTGLDRVPHNACNSQ